MDKELEKQIRKIVRQELNHNASELMREQAKIAEELKKISQ